MKINEPVGGVFFKPIKGIYKITNAVTGRVYIGQSRAVQSRLSSHFTDLSKGKHTSKSMQADWIEHGPDSFSVEIVEHVDGQYGRLLREAEVIADTIAAGIEIYNSAIVDPETVKNGAEIRKLKEAKRKQAEADKKARLERKKQARLKENEEKKARRARSSETAARRKNDLFGSRGLSESESLSYLAGGQEGLRFSETDLRSSQEGIDSTAETEGPPAASMDANGQSPEGHRDVYKSLSIRSNSYIGRKEDRLIDDWRFFCDGVSPNDVFSSPGYCHNAGCGDHLKLDLNDVHSMSYAIKKYVAPDVVKELIDWLADEEVIHYWFPGGDISYEEFEGMDTEDMAKLAG